MEKGGRENPGFGGVLVFCVALSVLLAVRTGVLAFFLSVLRDLCVSSFCFAVRIPNSCRVLLRYETHRCVFARAQHERHCFGSCYSPKPTLGIKSLKRRVRIEWRASYKP